MTMESVWEEQMFLIQDLPADRLERLTASADSLCEAVEADQPVNVVDEWAGRSAIPQLGVPNAGGI